ncbi:indolepyruvate oxidoreductase subunit beta [Candidatus Bipolaricaulota bacterium]|nr:indolepyruvate oxidoreductase subunit beta [Candidatus Bipolaricaulota bacterium]
MKDLNMLVTGVGGQGTILASDIIAEVGMRAGYDVKKSNVLGLAVRGGSVRSHVRWDPESVSAPMSSKGTVNYLISFEKLEAARNLSYLKQDGEVLVNNQEIPPVSVSAGDKAYPDINEIKKMTEKVARETYYFDGLATAEDLGSSRVLNVVILGAFSNFIDVDEKVWIDVISESVPPKFQELNKKAFQKGKKLVEGVDVE